MRYQHPHYLTPRQAAERAWREQCDKELSYPPAKQREPRRIWIMSKHGPKLVTQAKVYRP